MNKAHPGKRVLAACGDYEEIFIDSRWSDTPVRNHLTQVEKIL
jgi:hypothetical protein